MSEVASDAARGDEHAEDPMLGALVGERYRIDSRLGQGGMGVVYRGRHLSLDRPVAIKLLHAQLTADPDVARRFDREALAASKLDHPNIVRVLDAGATDTGARFIVMELLQGRELRELGEGPLTPHRAVDLAAQILRGLEHAHRRGFVHRDLKPENVFIVRDDDDREVAKLVDFGIVKLLAADGTDDKLTRAGLVFGTPRYMSPEQAAGGTVDERADLYAVGLLLYEMLAGTPPFDADEPGILLRMHLIADPPALPESVPGPLRAVVSRLLEKSAKDRFASAREAREALEGAATAAHAVTPSAVAPVSAIPSGSSAPVLLLPPSGVHRTVVAAPPPIVVARSRHPSNTLVAIVVLLTVSAAITYMTLTIRTCTAEPMPADVAAPAAVPTAPPTTTPVPAASRPAAIASPQEPAPEDQKIPPGHRKKEKKRKKKHEDEDHD